MTFLEALKTGRPMRRPWATAISPWLVLGTEAHAPTVTAPRWRVMESGAPAALHRFDYLAEDWEVMP